MAKSKSRRQVILVIVEGTTDLESLMYGLTQIFSGFGLAVHVVRGDVTLERDSAASTMCRKIGEIVTKWISANHLAQKADIARVIHVVDTDGAFVPNETVVEGEGLEDIGYETEAICAPSKPSVEKRNKRKSRNLIALVKTKTVLGGIPYQVFFMSCNLEHALHGRLNCKPWEKVELAAEFAQRFYGDVEGFKAFFEAAPLLLGNSYKNSWDLIQQGNESLHRHSNLAFAWKMGELPA